jgi:hypothetical protein
LPADDRKQAEASNSDVSRTKNEGNMKSDMKKKKKETYPAAHETTACA